MSWSLDLVSLVKAVQGECLQKKAAEFQGLATDSRENLKGKLFVALKGPRFDAHDFLSQAVAQGASALLVSDKSKVDLASMPVTVIKVSDTLKALQDLASYWREKQDLKIVAVTGSNGKTGTKTFAHTLISSLPVSSSPKSYNNHWGVPLSILSVSQEKSFLIQEIGTSQPGELASLCQLCKPFLSLVTTVGPSHLEGFGNISAVAKEKRQIYENSPQAFWLFNLDNPHTEKMYQDLKHLKKAGDLLTCSQVKEDADIYFQILNFKGKGMEVQGHLRGDKGKVELKFSGRHHLDNLMCACGIALFCNVPSKEIWKQLPLCELPKGREQWHFLPQSQISLCFDAYNANPLSMELFLSQMARAKRFALILGDMKELGESSLKYHQELGENENLKKCFLLWYIGDYGLEVREKLEKQGWKGFFLWAKEYNKGQLEDFKKHLKAGDQVGLKASRSLGLEKVFFDLTKEEVLL